MNVHMTKTTCMLVGARKRLNDSRPLNIIADDVNIQWLTLCAESTDSTF